MLLGSPPVRPLRSEHVAAARALCAVNPVLNVLPAARLLEDGVNISREFLGYFEDGELLGICWQGANLTPVTENLRALDMMTKACIKAGRRSTSIVGETSTVRYMWQRLERHWSTPIEFRWSQPMLGISEPYTGETDPLVRVAEVDELEDIFYAFVAMFTEELGYSPTALDGGAYYRSRVLRLLQMRRSLVRSERGSGVVDFKAEVGALANGVAQLHGVWVRESLRGQGIASRALGSVVNHVLAHQAPLVTLYVNDFNVPARKVYERVGFHQIEEFATILF